MYIVCSDLEGVFVPEIWIAVSERTGIDELKLTTRDISDYDVLMKRRLEILKIHGLTIHDIRNVISGISPLPGALEFLNWLRSETQVILVSDTFTEFANPLMEQLGWPTLLCNHLTIDNSGNITNYNLRQPQGKKKVAKAIRNLNYKIIGIGDSYNDIEMLRESDLGILYRPPLSVINDNKDLTVVKSYSELKTLVSEKLIS